MTNHPHHTPQRPVNGQVPLTIQPQPVNVQIIVDQVETTNGPAVLLRIASATGMSVYFLPIDTAKEVAKMINERATPIALS